MGWRLAHRLDRFQSSSRRQQSKELLEGNHTLSAFLQEHTFVLLRIQRPDQQDSIVFLACVRLRYEPWLMQYELWVGLELLVSGAGRVVDVDFDDLVFSGEWVLHDVCPLVRLLFVLMVDLRKVGCDCFLNRF